MSKTYTERVQVTLSGPTMGMRWSALYFAEPGLDQDPIRAALQSAVDEVDAQMSTWNAGSDLMRLNTEPVGDWMAVPDRLRAVLRLGIDAFRTRWTRPAAPR